MKIMNQLQKSGMKFLTDKKKILLTTLFFITANTFVFAQDQNIIPSNGFTLEGFLRGLLGISFLILTTLDYALQFLLRIVYFQFAIDGNQYNVIRHPFPPFALTVSQLLQFGF